MRLLGYIVIDRAERVYTGRGRGPWTKNPERFKIFEDRAQAQQTADAESSPSGCRVFEWFDESAA